MRKSFLYAWLCSLAVVSADTEDIPVERSINGIPVYSDDEEEEDKRSSKSSLSAPGVYASPDDQGTYPTCTRHALAKAIVDGLMKEIFLRNLQIDFDQDEVTDALKREHNDDDAIWPEALNWKTYKIKERNKPKYWNIRLHIIRLVERQIKDFVADIQKKVPNNTYVMVTPTLTRKESHCIYVNKVEVIDGREHASCINSHTSDPFPHIFLHKRGNIFYQVWCTVVNDEKKYSSQATDTDTLNNSTTTTSSSEEWAPGFATQIENSPIKTNGFGSSWSLMSHTHTKSSNKKEVKPRTKYSLFPSVKSLKDPHEILNELKRVKKIHIFICCLLLN